MSKSDVDGVCENLESCKLDVEKKIIDEELFKQPPPLEDCPICMIRLPSAKMGCRYNSCCGKMICSGCVHAPVYDNQGNKVNNKKCPFCRTPHPTSEEVLERYKKRVDLDDDKAIYTLGSFYRDGVNGYPQDHTKALELYHRAAELGCTDAYCNVGLAYEYSVGVEHDFTKATHYYGLAAMKGCVIARGFLGDMEGKAGNMNRALKHYMIAVRSGDSDSLNKIRDFYSKGHATKDEYTTALRLYQSYLGEIKSRQRDEAAAFDSEKYQYY